MSTQPELTRKVAQAWFESLESGDFDSALALLDDNVEWDNIPPIPIKGMHDIAPWLGRYHNKKDVIDSFGVWGALSELKAFKLVDLFVHDDEALGLAHETAKCKATGVVYNLYVPTIITVRNEKIVKWQVYWDPTPLIAAYEKNIYKHLIAAVKEGDLGLAEAALKDGADPDTVDPETGLTALMLAAGRGNAGMTRLLLSHCANVHMIDARAGASALHKACQAGSVKVARLLVDAGALVNLQAAGTGHTPLVEAIWFKHVDIVGYLLGQGTRVSLRTSYGFTLTDHLNFMLKANIEGRDKIEQIKVLLDARIDADRNAVQRQALMEATVAGDVDRVRNLLAAGAVVDERAPLLGGFNDHHTPLLVASRDGHTDIVRELLAAGADVNAVEPTFGAVPLHKATYNGHADIVRLLVGRQGADLNYQGPSNGYTPLHDAIWHGYADCAEILIEAGARLDICGHDGLRPLDIAVQVMGNSNPLYAMLKARTV